MMQPCTCIIMKTIATFILINCSPRTEDSTMNCEKLLTDMS